MPSWIDLETLDVMKFARAIERDCQEEVKWERLKLQWILDEKKILDEEKKQQVMSEAA